jgi:hypothetical protein
MVALTATDGCDVVSLGSQTVLRLQWRHSSDDAEGAWPMARL